MTEQIQPPTVGKFPPLSEVGGLYVITQKRGHLPVWRTDGNGKRVYRSINGDKNKPFLLLSSKQIVGHPGYFGYVSNQPVRVYQFLLDDEYVWEHTILVTLDTLSEWVKPISVLSRYNPAMKRLPRNLGTKYPGNKQ